MYSYAMQRPSQESIQVMEETVAGVTQYKAIQQLKIIHPVLHELDQIFTEYYALWLEERMYQLYTMDARQRYALLLKESAIS